ncbi:MAG: 3-deoxy-7-phosphoheptulonate synthase, partial [Hydrogenophaga sp.]
KQHEKQLEVAQNIADQIAGGSDSVFGVMIESHIEAGAQKFTPGKDRVDALNYGQSITDACLGWADSERALAVLASGVRAGRIAKA